MTQLGFLGHDAAHRQIFRSGPWNLWAARVLAMAAGLSHEWWKGKHNTHHSAPNQEGRDPDIAPGAFAFTRAAVEGRRTALTRWLARHQGWYFFPLLTLEGLNLHAASVRPLVARRGHPHPADRGRAGRAAADGVRRGGAARACRPARPSRSSPSSRRSSGCAWAGRSRPTTSACRSSPSAPGSTSSAVRCSCPATSAAGSGSTSSWAASTTRSSTTCSRACRARTCGWPGRSCGPTATPTR